MTFLSILQIDANLKEVKMQMENYSSLEEAQPVHFIKYLVETGAFSHLAYFQNWIEQDEMDDMLKKMHYPVLVFQKEQSSYVPTILYKKEKLTYYSFRNDRTEESTSISNSLVQGSDISDYPELSKKILVVTCFPNHPVFSVKDRFKEPVRESKLQTLDRFFRLIASEKREIGYIYIYAVIAGIISLSLPLGVQSIIGFISSGQVSTSVVVLIVFIIVGILITGGMQVMQLTIAEHIQQRLFAKTAFEFAFRIPKIKIESVLKYYPPELMNRFFDIITLQKGLAKILLEFSAALLQIILGLLLLSFYHSSFIFFGIFLVLILAAILRFTGPKGLKTSLYESKYKYLLANWLEEIAKSLSTFKLAGYSNLPLEKTDYYVSNYIHARKHHFKVLVIQYLSFITFKTLVTAGLLILGCLLLIEKQINIGQFVASEIIIILIMNAVEKIIIQLDTVYDVLTSIEKIGAVTDLPIEVPSGINIDNFSKDSAGLSLKIRNLRYKFPSEQNYVLKDINLEINKGERICVSGYSDSGKTTFINIILGFLTSYEGVIAFNNLSLRDINRNSLINLIGDNVSQEDLFDGTIIENITIGRPNVRLEDVIWAIECAGLSDFVFAQPNGIHTKLINGSMGLSESIARKIILARSIVAKPKLLILEDFMLGLEKEQKVKLLSLLTGKDFNWTLIIVSNDPEIMQMCSRTVIMKAGTIVAQGSYEEISSEPHFKALV